MPNTSIYDYEPGKPYSAGQTIDRANLRHIGYFRTFREAIMACLACHKETGCAITEVYGPGFHSIHSESSWLELLDWMDSRQQGEE